MRSACAISEDQVQVLMLYPVYSWIHPSPWGLPLSQDQMGLTLVFKGLGPVEGLAVRTWGVHPSTHPSNLCLYLT